MSGSVLREPPADPYCHDPAPHTAHCRHSIVLKIWMTRPFLNQHVALQYSTTASFFNKGLQTLDGTVSIGRSLLNIDRVLRVQ